MSASPALVPTTQLRDLDLTEEPPETAGARLLRTFGWTAVTGATVAAATLVGMALSVVGAIGVLIVGVLALAFVAVLAVVVAAALVVLAAVMIALAVCAIGLASVAGAVWAVVGFFRVSARVGEGLWRALRPQTPAMA